MAMVVAMASKGLAWNCFMKPVFTAIIKKITPPSRIRRVSGNCRTRSQSAGWGFE